MACSQSLGEHIKGMIEALDGFGGACETENKALAVLCEIGRALHPQFDREFDAKAVAAPIVAAIEELHKAEERQEPYPVLRALRLAVGQALAHAGEESTIPAH